MRPLRPEPPKDEPELYARALSLTGASLGELADRFDQPSPPDLARTKGWVGGLLEFALGAVAGTKPEPDFSHLGVELKTLPLGKDGEPSESTFVCVAPLLEIGSLAWEPSPVRRKLARVLWIPVEADPLLPLRVRRLERPFLWSPSPEQEEILKADWDELARLVRAGDLSGLDAKKGRWLQLRPKAADNRARTMAKDGAGGLIPTHPRGFYLRRSFTRPLWALHRA